MQSELSNSEKTTPTTRRRPKKTLQDFEVTNVPGRSTPDLGKGSYGSVKLVQEKGRLDQLFAMKIVIAYALSY